MELLSAAAGFVYNVVTNSIFFCTCHIKNKSDKENAQGKSNFHKVFVKNEEL